MTCLLGEEPDDVSLSMAFNEDGLQSIYLVVIQSVLNEALF